jgi:hypothetical protein
MLGPDGIIRGRVYTPAAGQHGFHPHKAVDVPGEVEHRLIKNHIGGYPHWSPANFNLHSRRNRCHGRIRKSWPEMTAFRGRFWLYLFYFSVRGRIWWPDLRTIRYACLFCRKTYLLLLIMGPVSLIMVFFIFDMVRFLALAFTLLDFLFQHLHNISKIFFYGSSRFLILILNLDIYLFTVNHYLEGGLYAQPYLATINTKHRYLDIVADSYRLPQLPCQYQHLTLRGEKM